MKSKKNPWGLALLALSLLAALNPLWAAECCDPTWVIDISTGQDANGDGIDDNWSVTDPGGSSGLAPLVPTHPAWRGGSALAFNTGPFGTARYPVLGDGRWISGGSLTGTYVYETSFVLDDHEDFWIAGEWDADNAIQIFLNGIATGIQSNLPFSTPPAPWLSNSAGASHPCARPSDGLLQPTCGGPDPVCGTFNFRCAQREDEFREIHPFVLSSVAQPGLFNIGGLNTLRVEVTNTEGPSGFLLTGGSGTSIASGATVGPCPPVLACGAAPGDPEPPCGRCEIDCNAPATIVPPDAPIEIAATTCDDCLVEVTGYDCWAINGAGKIIDKKDSCVVDFFDGVLQIQDSGGVGDHITWQVTATHLATGETTGAECGVEVVKPGRRK